MTLIRVLWKLSVFAILVVAYCAISLFWRVWSRDLVKRRHHYTHTVSFFCNLALRVIGLRTRTINHPANPKSYLIVGNHLGILDIFVLSSIHPSLFVTSVDMRETPGLGFLTEMGGCLYVERRNRSTVSENIIEIREALKQKFSVVIYPEGTSTNGERVLPFKKSLLVAAAGTGVPILPVIVNYRKVNGEPMSHKWRDHIFWYGDHGFFPHVIRLFGLRSIDVDLEFEKEMMVHSEQERREIAAHLQSVIEAKFTPVPMPH
jgi:1-acyl-sn-glycerol-3-phosphate acyltransferase